MLQAATKLSLENLDHVLTYVLVHSSAPELTKGIALAEFEKLVKLKVMPKVENFDVGGIVVTKEVFDEIVSSMAIGRKLSAIKALRTHTGAGLKDAKEAIERKWPKPQTPQW